MNNREELEILQEPCQRFQVLLESRLVDEIELSDADAAFASTHKASCPECGLYASMLDTMEIFEEETANEEEDATVRELVVTRFAHKQKRRQRLFAFAAAVLVAALGVVFFARYAADSSAAEFELAKGTIALEGETVSQGGQFRLSKEVASPMHRDALIQIPETLFIAIQKDARIRLVESTERRLSIALDKGRMAVHLVPDGPLDLTVVLPTGEVDVVGTVFVVDASSSDSRVDVVKGSVAVKYKKDTKRQRRLDAGWSFSLSGKQKKKRAAVKSDPLLKLLGVDGGKAADDLSQDPSDESEDGARSGRRRRAKSGKPTLESLLTSARECRVRQDWACAVSHYRRIISLYPSRPDASTAMVSAAQILLDKMRKPADALTYFKRYQRRRPTGGLGREALFGECTALKALRRTAQERTCLEQYLEKYPGTLYSKMAKSRLTGIVEK